jgi:hypothetical protein
MSEIYENFKPINQTEKEIVECCEKVKELLIFKNRSYGNSALDPVRIFSKSNNTEQLLVRIDDKLSRFARGSDYPGDNDVDDLIGYLILLKVSKRDNWR